MNIFSQERKPHQNAYIERYNRTIRYSWLSKYHFESIEEVQTTIEMREKITAKKGLESGAKLIPNRVYIEQHPIEVNFKEIFSN